MQCVLPAQANHAKDLNQVTRIGMEQMKVSVQLRQHTLWNRPRLAARTPQFVLIKDQMAGGSLWPLMQLNVVTGTFSAGSRSNPPNTLTDTLPQGTTFVAETHAISTWGCVTQPSATRVRSLALTTIQSILLQQTALAESLRPAYRMLQRLRLRPPGVWSGSPNRPSIQSFLAKRRRTNDIRPQIRQMFTE